jgi:CRISPR-associated protein Cmr4
MLYLHALSPVHTGTGQAVDVIDLPVAREKITDWPYVAGSRLKGVLRDVCAASDGADPALIRAAFGPDTRHAADHAGALTFTDAHLLCLPVRSLYGTFAWVTCPLALRRWHRDHVAAGLTPPPIPSSFSLTPPTAPEPMPKHRPRTAVLVRQAKVPIAAPLGSEWVAYLEDLDVLVVGNADAEEIAKAIAEAVFGTSTWAALFKQRFGIVPDDLFTFLAKTATEVVARIKLHDESKTVENLWYEEALPMETILAGPVLSPSGTPPRTGETPAPAYTGADLLGVVEGQQDAVIQIGGGASVGRGLTRVRLSGEGKA